MKGLILAVWAVLAGLFLAAPVRAAWPADTITSRYGMKVPSTGTLNYGLKVNDWAIKLDTMTASQFNSNTFIAGSSNTFIGPVSMPSVTSSMTIAGAGGLGVTYGVTASTGNFTAGVDASSVTMHGALNPQHKTTAQLLALSPAIGDQYYCSDCVPSAFVVVATGTGAGNFNFSGSGGGGLSSIKIASGSYVNGATGDENPAQSVQGLYLSTSSLLGFDIHGSSAVLQFKGFVPALAAGTWNPGGATTQSSPGVCQWSNSTGTWTQGNNKANFSCSGSAMNSGSNLVGVALLLDGVIVSSVAVYTQGNDGPLPVSYQTPTALSAGSHSACISAWTSAGTMTLPSNGSTLQVGTGYQCTVTEIATVGAGYSAPASSRTVNLAGKNVAGQASYSIAVDTLAITTSGGPVDVACDGSMSEIAANGGGCWDVLVDGLHADGDSPTTGFGCSGFYTGSGWTAGEPSMSHRFLSIAAGTHSFGFVFKGGSSGQMNLGQQNATVNSTFYCRASEVRNAAGTGDVCTNCNQTLTGQTTVGPGGQLIIAPSVAIATVSFSSGIIVGNWSLIASTHPVAATSTYFYGLVSTSPIGGTAYSRVRYRVDFNLKWNTTTGFLQGRFSDDTGASNHVYNSQGQGAGSAAIGSAAAAQCILHFPNTAINVGNGIIGAFEFAPLSGDDTQIYGRSDYETIINTETTGLLTGEQGCRYKGTTPLSSLKLMASAGAYTGDISIYAKIVP